MDSVRRAFGYTTEEDRKAAASTMRDMSLHPTPANRLAVEVADVLVGRHPGERRPLPDGLVRLMVPELSHEARPLPTDHDVRRLTIAEAVVRTVDRHLDHGSDAGVGRELGRAVRREAVRNMRGPSVMAGSLDNALRERTERHGMEVAAFMAYGDAVEKQHVRHVQDLPRRGEVGKTVERLRELPAFRGAKVPERGPELGSWVDRGLRVERAMARSGIMAPEQVVRSAHAVMRDAPVETLSLEPRARPNFEAAEKIEGPARRTAVEQWLTSPQNTVPPAAVRGSPGPERTPDLQPLSPSMQASLAASRGRGM
jgi:hypothetical protein